MTGGGVSAVVRIGSSSWEPGGTPTKNTQTHTQTYILSMVIHNPLSLLYMYVSLTELLCRELQLGFPMN